MAQWQPNPKVIQQEFPNESIVLYDSSSEILIDERIIDSKSLVKISWFPFPKITININYSGQLCGLKDIELNLTELVPPYRVKVRMLTHQSIRSTGVNTITGDLKEAFIIGNVNKLSSLTFYVINFSSFGFSNQSIIELNDKGNRNKIKREGWLDFPEQLIFGYENWHIVLAKIDKTDEFEKRLKSQGGYGITHICKIEHLDNTSFNLDEGRKIINSLIYYLSFVRGFWIAPILISGFDKNGNQILEDWSASDIKADLWKHITHSWSTSDSIEIANGFSGFMKKWQDEFWKDTIKNSIQWYLESLNHVSGYNTSIILVQAALEKLAWVYLNDNECISKEGFSKITVDDKIRLFLKFLDIPIISLGKSELSKIAKANNWKSSIDVIGKIRNSIIHPEVSRNKRDISLSEEIMNETLIIARKYLLKILLKLFEYPCSMNEYHLSIIEHQSQSTLKMISSNPNIISKISESNPKTISELIDL